MDLIARWIQRHGLIMALAIPAAEFYLIRSICKPDSALYLNQAFMFTMVTGITAFFVIIRDIKDFSLHTRTALLNLLMLLLFITLEVGMRDLDEELNGFIMALAMVSSLFLFVTPELCVSRLRHKPAPGYFLGIALVTQLVYVVLWNIVVVKQVVWAHGLSSYSVGPARYVLGVLGYDILPGSELKVINTPSYSVTVNFQCSGLEAVIFFITIFSLVMMLDHESMSPRHMVCGYIVGILYMCVINILRIVILVAHGAETVKRMGAQAAQATVELWHNNLGWLIYCVGLMFFFAVFFRATQVRDRASSSR